MCLNETMKRHLCFLAFWTLSVLLLWRLLNTLAHLSFGDERYTYLATIPLVSAFLVFIDRKRLFENFERPRPLMVLTGILGILLYYILLARQSTPALDEFSLQVGAFTVVVVWVAGFAACYGMRTMRVARFPLCFLLLMIPPPLSVLEKMSVALQHGSADTAYALFKLIGVPVFRQGFVFTLPGISIEVAEQCSGIRSSIALLMTSVLLGHLVLHSPWRKLGLILVTIPVAIFKNAIRIVVISTLGVYVRQDFLFGDLHRNGGLPFSLLALAMLVPLIWILQRSERRLPKLEAE